MRLMKRLFKPIDFVGQYFYTKNNLTVKSTGCARYPRDIRGTQVQNQAVLKRIKRTVSLKRWSCVSVSGRVDSKNNQTRLVALSARASLTKMPCAFFVSV